MSRAVRVRDDELETERGARAKKRSLAVDRSTSPRSPGDLAVRRSSHSHPEILFAIFEPDEAQSGAKQGRVCDVVESAAEESSDPPSSPIYEPYIPDELAADRVAHAAFKLAEAKYRAEKFRVAHLFTMDHYWHKPYSCLRKDRRLLPIRELARDAILSAAKSVVLLSSFLENQPLNKCCGLWFQRDDQRKTALVLTSAHLIRKDDIHKWKQQWTGEYHKNAKVIIHLLDNTTTPGHLIYLQEHYEFAIYEVQVDKPVHLPTSNDRVHSGQDVFRLGRDANLDIKITHGNLAYDIPTRYERCHYMYFLRDASSLKLLHDDGGPIIDLGGKVVGLVNNQINETFVPSSILHKCFDFWRRFNCMPRLHLGMTFSPIKFLDPICIERMTRKHNIDSGLIVEQVSKESHAEKIGIRKGDVIESFNGKHISTTIELESMLIDICWDHFDQRKKLNTEKDVSVKIFDATKICQRTRNLTAIVSDRGEDIVKGAYPIMGEEAMSVL
ncbi:probable periplasmic serine endoprotease DegP-like [Triticum dicoccoides]|uniref:probable periplasmic serine endoprotease DegP-like n=1 Tax=Triticum dicoccoides TaxID=85692 RepID=UPI00188F8518|nr:probable periplasmic serine endoprotease DegP-like [Triticum dicoccoides]